MSPAPILFDCRAILERLLKTEPGGVAVRIIPPLAGVTLTDRNIRRRTDLVRNGPTRTHDREACPDGVTTVRFVLSSPRTYAPHGRAIFHTRGQLSLEQRNRSSPRRLARIISSTKPVAACADIHLPRCGSSTRTCGRHRGPRPRSVAELTTSMSSYDEGVFRNSSRSGSDPGDEAG